MDQEMKVKENRLRRAAERRGYRLEKSRRRDPQAADFGGFMLVNAERNFAVLGATPFAYSASLDEIEGYFAGPLKSIIDEYRTGAEGVEKLIAFLKSGELRPLHETINQSVLKAEKLLNDLRSLLEDVLRRVYEEDGSA